VRPNNTTVLVAFVVTAAALLVIVAYVASTLKRTPVTAIPEQALPVIERAGPLDIYPNSKRTPGAVSPKLNEANLAETICNPDWSTRSIRPPASYTTRLKRDQMRAWGLPGRMRDYEEDHLIPLELGGDPTDTRNLWPEPYTSPGARQKDIVENYLHKQVCAGTLGPVRKVLLFCWPARRDSVNRPTGSANRHGTSRWRSLPGPGAWGFRAWHLGPD